MVRLGGLWLNTSKAGKKYLSGNLGAARILIFENSSKEPGSNQPDYELYVDGATQTESSDTESKL